MSKRLQLLKRDWSARALLLGEVRTSWDEGLLIVVVRTLAGDLVLDNWRRVAANCLVVGNPARVVRRFARTGRGDVASSPVASAGWQS